MEIFLFICIIILTVFFLVKKVFYSAKSNLFKDQAAWSGKEIKIKYNKKKETSDLKNNNNYLKMVADESKLYLEDQSIQEEE
tara:strand:- start:748 stop:993 length:246 start_codon:yes stop_codon:yes gene_type:complete